MSLFTKALRFLSTKVDPDFYRKNLFIKHIVDDFITKQPTGNLLPSSNPLQPGCRQSICISRVDLYAILKQTPTQHLSLVFEFLRSKDVKVDYSDYSHKLKSSVIVQHPPTCFLAPSLNDYQVVLYTDASGWESKTSTFFVGIVVFYFDGKQWVGEKFAKEIISTSISQAESIASWEGLQVLLQKNLYMKKVLHLCDSDVHIQRVRKFVMTPQVDLFRFWSDYFDVFRKFPFLTIETVYSEGNIAHYPANILRLQRLLAVKGEDQKTRSKLEEAFGEEKKLLADLLSGKPSFVFRHTVYVPSI